MTKEKDVKLKICSKCKIEKNINEFHTRKDSKDGHRNECKQCKSICDHKYNENNKEQKKQYREKNKEKRKEYNKQYNEKNIEKAKQYREKNKEKIKEQKKQYYEKNKEKAKQYYERNKEKIIEQKKQYYEKNKEKAKQYYERNKEKISKYENFRYHNDKIHKIKHILRIRIHDALKGKNKSKKTLELLGCSIEELLQQFENQFTEGMTWDKFFAGEIHIDHIRPCSSFNLLLEEEQKKCFHYTNLQPLWAEDNIKKSNKYILES